MRWWVLAALAAAVFVLAILVLRNRSTEDSAPEQEQVHAAPTGTCPDRDARPTKVFVNELSAAVRIQAAGTVKLRIDDEPAYPTTDGVMLLEAGEHRVRADDAQARSSQITIRVEPFTPALIDARTEGDLVTLVVIGAACTSCAKTVGVVELTPVAQTHGSALDDARIALNTGDWPTAAEALRHAPASLRKSEAFARLSSATLAFGGLSSEALALTRAWAPKLPDTLDAMEAPESARRSSVALKRWNTLTERSTTLADAFSPDAPGLVANATARFNALSETFSKASTDKDLIEQESAVEAAESARATLVRELRALKPNDCAWQARITRLM